MESPEFSRIDPERKEFYQEKLGRALEKIKPGDKVLVACHSDADGMTGGGIAEYFLEENKEGVQIGTCHYILDDERFYETAKDYDHIIVVDLWVDARQGHQENLRKLSEEGKNVIILDHHDERYDPSKIRFGGSHDNEIPETIGDNILYVTPNRLKSPIGHNLTGAMVAYSMLAPFSKSGLKKMKKFLPIAISGDYAREYWPELLEEIGDQELLDTLGHALNGGHSIEGATNIVRAMTKAEDPQQLLEVEEVKVLMNILNWVRERIKKVNADAPFLIHSHLEPEDLEDKVFEHPSVRKPPEITNIFADELRLLFRDRMVLITQEKKDYLGLSFRSSSDEPKFDTRRLSRKFGGDGHHPASGAKILFSETPKEEAFAQVEQMIHEENEKFLQAIG